MILLTAEQLGELTGRTQAAAQIRWLKERNWRFEIGGDGLPKVALSFFENCMGSGERNPPEQNFLANDQWQVNTEALKHITH